MKKSTSYIVITLTVAMSLACSAASAKTEPVGDSPVRAKVSGSSQIESVEPAGQPVAPFVSPTPEKVERINDEPAKLVRNFYEYYLDGFPSVDEERVIFSRYMTGKLLSAAIDAWDGDMFLDAQDFDETWKDNFTVSPAQVSGKKAKVKVNLNGKMFRWALEVTVVKQGNAWKLDSVKNISS